MSFERTRDVIDYMRDMHASLGSYYIQLSDTAEKQKVKMLLDYLSRHQSHLALSLQKYEADASHKILETWFQYTPQLDILKMLDKQSLEAEMSVDEVIKLAIDLDDAMINIYKEMAENTHSSDVKDVFNNLIQMEQQEKLRSVRDALMLQDL